MNCMYVILLPLIFTNILWYFFGTIEDKPRLTNITHTDFAVETYQVTNEGPVRNWRCWSKHSRGIAESNSFLFWLQLANEQQVKFRLGFTL